MKRNYFGNLGLKVLVNPADIVACPTIHDYNQEGKLRTCAYYPFSTITYDKLGDIQDDITEDGIEYASECDFISKIAYSGIVNNDDIDHYSLTIPTCVEINKDKMYENLIEIANQFNHNA